MLELKVIDHGDKIKTNLKAENCPGSLILFAIGKLWKRVKDEIPSVPDETILEYIQEVIKDFENQDKDRVNEN